MYSSSEYRVNQPSAFTRKPEDDRSIQNVACSSTNNTSRPTLSCDEDMFGFLKSMKSDLDKHNTKIEVDLQHVNCKIDSILTTIDALKCDNETLKKDNASLREQMSTLQDRLDKIEGQSRRNNIRFSGIAGTINETWADTETKLRNFLHDKLNLGEQAFQFDIDRAHRIKSRDPNMCTVIAKFPRYKDCETILNKAKATPVPGHTVQHDFTERVKRHRRILGKRMLEERARGNYAVVRHDKLIVNDCVYRYDDNAGCTVRIGSRPRSSRTVRGNNSGPSHDHYNDEQPDINADSDVCEA